MKLFLKGNTNLKYIFAITLVIGLVIIGFLLSNKPIGNTVVPEEEVVVEEEKKEESRVEVPKTEEPKEEKKEEPISQKPQLQVISPTKDQVIKFDFASNNFNINIKAKASSNENRIKVLVKDEQDNILFDDFASLSEEGFFTAKAEISSDGKMFVEVKEIDDKLIVHSDSVSVSLVKAVDPYQIISFLPTLNQKAIYYLKNGDIWRSKVYSKDNIEEELYIDNEKDILTFAISEDNMHLAYAIDQFDIEEQKYTGIYQGRIFGDSIILHNMETKEEEIIFEDNTKQGSGIISLLFSPDNRSLFFSNMFVWSIDLANYSKSKLDFLPSNAKDGFCGAYELREFSPDSKLLMIDALCFETTPQYLVDVINRKIKQECRVGNILEAGYDSIETFLGNNNFLKIEYADRVNRSKESLNVYSINGNLQKIITAFDVKESFSIRNKPDFESIYIAFYNFESGNTYAKIDKNTYELSPLDKDMNLLIFSSNTLWLTDTEYSDPVKVFSQGTAGGLPWPIVTGSF